MLFKQTISHLPFKQWLRHDSENKKLLGLLAIVIVISFGWLKYLYPYPNFMPPDSYNYLESAANNNFINMWPTGYAKFLQLVNVFTRSHFVLVIGQYFLLMGSVAYFLFSIRYLLSPGKWLFRVLFCLSIINPLLPHIANFVSSDALFTALSLVWFTQLIWITCRPTRLLLILHAIIVLAAFAVRFTGIYYPLLSIALIYVMEMPSKTRWIGIITVAILIMSFIGSTQYEYHKRTHIAQFSAFGGWQLASNALYGYAFDQPDAIETVPSVFKELHTIVNQHMDSLKNISFRPDREPGVYYQWDFKSPLLLYLNKQMWKKEVSYFERWASIAPLYGHYGRWLIRHHPAAFFSHFIWPNLKRYYAPPPYFMGYYIMGYTTIDPAAVNWFKLKNNKPTIRAKDREIHVTSVITIMLSIINPAFFICLLFFIAFAGFRCCSPNTKRILVCMLVVWLTNMFFSVLSAPIELRYQIFPTVITITFLILFMAWFFDYLKSESRINKTPIITKLKSAQ